MIVPSGSTNVIRADHCGSLIRPDYLRRARLEHRRGRLSTTDLRAVEDRAVLDALELQRGAGLTIFTDGEFRRQLYHSALVRVDGISDAGPNLEQFPDLKALNPAEQAEHATVNPVIVGKLHASERLTADEIPFLRAHARGPFKITVPSPHLLPRTSFRPGTSEIAYSSWEEAFEDFITVIADEIRGAADDGVPYVQLDAPAYLVDILRDHRERQGSQDSTSLATKLEGDNRCLRAAKRSDNIVGVHICLGTYVHRGGGPLGGGGEYDPAIVGEILNTLEADIISIEYSERVLGVDVFREVEPAEKIIALGMLNTRDPRLECQDSLIRKIDAVSKLIPLDNLAICPSCGFSAAAAAAWMDSEAQKRKLELLVDTADRIWGRT
jgi:5-methyltetrahydropteroyltriglutamate--homocysteine methyltransferase